jgi:hypothetical protein
LPKLSHYLMADNIEPLLERGYCYEICDKAGVIDSAVVEAFLGAPIDLPLPSD